MQHGRTVQGLKTPAVLLATAPLEAVLPHAQISRHAAGELIATGDQLLEWVFCVLNGRCEEHRRSSTGEILVHRTFTRGETFGGCTDDSPECLGAIIVACEESVVLRMRCQELSARTSELMGHDSRMPESERETAWFGGAVSRRTRGRLQTLAILSPDLPASWLGERLAVALHAETGESVALVLLVPPEPHTKGPRDTIDWTLGDAASPLPSAGRMQGGFHRLCVGVPHNLQEGGAVAHLMETLARRYDHVLVTAQTEEIPFSAWYECVARSVSAYLFVQPAAEDAQRLELLLRELKLRLNSHVPVRLKTVLCVGANESVRDFDARIERAGLPIHAHLRGCPTLTGWREDRQFGEPAEPFAANARWLARDMADCLVGLALSSGGAKGFAHIGVIQVLEENGIEVDVVAGTSMGAYIGSLWASGCDGARMEQLAREMEARRAMWSLIDPAFPPRQGFLRGYALKHRLMQTIGRARFADLARPLRVIATSLNAQERVVFSSGEVAAAVHASVAVPGLCVPVTLGDESYVDGGIADPLPVDVLQEMGVRTIIAVNTIPTPERLRYWRQKAQSARAQHDAEHQRRWWRRVFPIEKHLNYLAPGNILEILMRSVHGAQSRAAENACRRASFVLRPDICDDRWLDLHHPGQYLAAGREIASRHVDEIKALIREEGEHHELESTPEPLVAVA
ncbi:MAG: hypothetical protein EPO07_14970 [Verrucomicrobia bacterium]|nr:MAG: hypothetical protein EPO07_14970 [Verrucomicrobiota bacterium]